MTPLAALVAYVDYSNPVLGLLGVLYLVFIIWCAYRTARNGRWLLFVLGLFCGGLFWIIGAFIGPRPSAY